MENEKWHLPFMVCSCFRTDSSKFEIFLLKRVMFASHFNDKSLTAFSKDPVLAEANTNRFARLSYCLSSLSIFSLTVTSTAFSRDK